MTAALLWQRKATQQALITAQKENARSLQLNEVVLDLFRKPNPYQRNGPNLTVKELIDSSLLDMNADTMEQVEIKTELLLTFGHALIGMGLFEEAAYRLGEAVELAKAKLPANHPRIAKLLAMQGGAYIFLSRVTQGEACLNEALALHNRHLPAHHPDRIQTYLYFGYLSLNTRNYEQGKKLLAQALFIHQQYPDRDDLEPYLTHSVMGRVLSYLGENDQALIHHQKSYELASSAWGFEHPTLAETLNSYATHFHRTGDIDLARTLYEESLRIQDSRFRPCHPLLVYSRSLAASLFLQLGQLQTAETLFKQVLLCGENNPDACFTVYVMNWNNIGYVHQLQKRWAEADKAYETFHQFARETFGEHSFHYGKSSLNIAWSAMEQGKDRKARKWYEQGIQQLTSAGYGEGYQVNMAQAFFAEVEARNGRTKDAVDRLDRALPHLKNILGADHPDVLTFEEKRTRWSKQGIDR